MEKSWEKNLSVHISRTISPDGRDTFESTQALSERMFEFASVKNGDRLVHPTFRVIRQSCSAKSLSLK